MKRFRILLIVPMTVLFCGLLLTACGKNNSNWKSIAETTIAEMTKADANFKITVTDMPVDGTVNDTAPQEIIVDGNKMKSDTTYWAKYMRFEDNTVYWYLPYGEDWYMTPGEVYTEQHAFKTLWQTQVRNIGIFAVLPTTLADLKNVKYEGGNKYTYRLVPDIAGAIPAVVGYDPVLDYTFITDGTQVTEIQLRGVSYKITYGGQTVTLPDATEPTKLPAPQNLAINDGVLSWDAVPGASEYYVTIYMYTCITYQTTAYHYRGAQYETGTTMNLLERLESQPDVFVHNDYRITVQAIFPVFRTAYDSPESAPITYKTAGIEDEIRYIYFMRYVNAYDRNSTLADVSIRQMYGEYNGAYAVMIDYSGVGHGLPALGYEVDGVTFQYDGHGNSIQIYKDGEFYSLADAFTENIITHDNLVSIAEIQNG